MKKINKFTVAIIIFFLVVGINLTNTKKVNAAEKGNTETIKNGVLQQSKTGWITKDGKKYYVQANGEVAKYTQTIDGKTYYFVDKDGEMFTGWLKYEDNNEWHYFDKNGVMQTGFIKVDGKTYYLNKDGARVKYTQAIDGKTYYFNGSGVMLTGWIQFSSNNKWRYFNEDGVMQTGFIKVDGNTYYLDKDGERVEYSQTIDGKTYYFNGSGVMLTGWIKFLSNNEWRYFDENGVLQPSKTGWINEDGKRYYMQANGELAKYTQTIDGKTYYFVDKDGEMFTGWLKYEDSNKWSYFNKNGEMVKYTQTIDGKTYYFDKDGEMFTGWLKYIDNNEWHYFSPKDGHMMTNTTIDGYYISESGKREDKDDKGDRVVNYAKKFLGTKYVYGGTTPSGFDCSGFTQYVYKHALGIDISRTTYTQISHGKAVSRSDLKVGDLVFPHAGHVGIYIGNGKIIHAPQTGDVVKISNIWSFYAARRIIN
ncbi:C40 family peptidase [Clostridium sardiniense]|uniref:C40 family peptidase n=1 Tax=Clostridium sardiniense TaxID=29369 RepID=A0ABS7KU23_CLOSR|nr:NlpC/P60 family protein [Clostridium sardiniense]MBY0754265.1 C40 family peptidase [Clostridium sardiniense]MDQ0461242.1 glucan-binding repeat-containing protein [Clostridium sardiniense]